MGSVSPLQDLNFTPSTTTATTTTTTATPPFKIPKTEPKAEPIDYSFDPSSLHSQQSLQNNPFPNSTPQSLPNPQTTHPSPPSLHNGDKAQPLDSETGAIVPRDELSSPAAVNDDSAGLARGSRRYVQRSNELVRVSGLDTDYFLQFRAHVRRTRMIYDALRIFTGFEAEKRFNKTGQVSEMGKGEGMSPNSIYSEGAPTRARPGFFRGDLTAAQLMRERGMWLYRDKRIVGPVPGIEVGDIFLFRMELCVLGLHGTVQAGIDYLPASQSSNGEPIATSIIVSGGYEDDEDVGDTIIYTGQGGQDKWFRQCADQKLEKGNLALERSMRYGIEVRVIRGLKGDNGYNKIYVYDGLYKICDYWFDVGRSGFGVYKYRLTRIEGQPEMGSVKLRFALSLRVSPLSVRPKGYVSLDVSNGKESAPVLLFNDIDNNYDPIYFEYTTMTLFPPFVLGVVNPVVGCDCSSGCTDSCACAVKNGGEFAYDQHGFLVRGKPVVFECGAFCQCPPDCRNRVSQKGLAKRLEIFRSRETGWGVRTLDLIHAGSFICEYTGVVLTKDQAELFTMNGDRLIYPSQFTNKQVQWGDLSMVYPDYVHPSSPSISPLDFALDVSKLRNVACYISHSTASNVMAQCVLYDHNNLMFPHLMLFAIENIPPLGELSMDYGVADESTGKLAICN